MSRMTGASVDLAFADPPFNIGYKYDVYEDRLAADLLVERLRRNPASHSNKDLVVNNYKVGLFSGGQRVT
jgi:hypothetical protein